MGALSRFAPNPLTEAQSRSCALANRLVGVGATVEALKLYDQVLGSAEAGAQDLACAKSGIDNSLGLQDCMVATRLANQGLLDDATTYYKTVLSSSQREDTDHCASDGLQRITLQRCALGDAFLDQGLYDDAARIYSGVLTSEANGAEGSCASHGLNRLVSARCALAGRLAELGLTDQALSMYLAILTGTTAGLPSAQCAAAGISALTAPSSKVPSPPTLPKTVSFRLGPFPGMASRTSFVELWANGAAETSSSGTSLARPTFLNLVLGGLRRLGRDAGGWVAGRSAEVGPYEWAAVIVFCLLASRVWAGYRQRWRRPFVDVGTVKDGTGGGGPASADSLSNAVAARITHQLAVGGLLPAPSLPSGSMATDAVSVVESSPLPQANWLGTVIRAISRLIPAHRSARVTGTVVSRPDGDNRCGMTALVAVDAHGTAVRTFWEATYEEVADSVAGFAYACLTKPIDRISPAWSSWTKEDGSSITLYQRGLEFEHEANKLRARGMDPDPVLGRALLAYTAASSIEPDQVLVRLRIANLQELAKKWAQAIRIYYKHDQTEPLIFDARYRFAIALSLADRLAPQLIVDRCEDLATYIDQRMQNNLLRRHLDAVPPGQIDEEQYAEPIKQDLICYAAECLRQLYAEISWWAALRHWVDSLRPSKSVERRRHEFFLLSRPWDKTRRTRRNVVKLAQYCTQIHRGASSVTEERVDKRMRFGHAKNWQLRYNAVCCYSWLLLRMQGQANERLAIKAVTQLDSAYREAVGHLDMAWILTDPDLVHLRATNQFRGWQELHRPINY